MSKGNLFSFQLEATARDPSGYYFPRWDIAQEITVTAKNFTEACEIASDALGEARRGWPWAFKAKNINHIQSGGGES